MLINSNEINHRELAVYNNINAAISSNTRYTPFGINLPLQEQLKPLKECN